MKKEVKKVFCSFSDEEYAVVEKKATGLGMSIPKFVEYATTLFVDMPRTETPNLAEIQSAIDKFIEDFDGETFICSTPFDNWAQMTTSAKRTAAAQMKKLVDDGTIEKADPASKSHKATVYKKVKKDK